MSFNTIAFHNYPLVVPVPRSGRPEPFQPRHRRASTVMQGRGSQARHGVREMPRLDARSNLQPHVSREYSCMWNDVEVKNDWALAAKGQAADSACRPQHGHAHATSHEQRAREHKYRKRVSFEEPVRDGRPSVDKTRKRGRSVDRERERRVSVDRGHNLRLPVEYERGRCTLAGHHHRYGSVSSREVRPPVSAISFKPPAQCRYPRRPSVEYVTDHDYPCGHRYPIYILPPPAPAPMIHLPSQRRDRVSVDRHLPFPSTNVPQSDKLTKPSGLARFNPFNRLRTESISPAQTREPPKVHSNRLQRKSTAAR